MDALLQQGTEGHVLCQRPVHRALLGHVRTATQDAREACENEEHVGHVPSEKAKAVGGPLRLSSLACHQTRADLSFLSKGGSGNVLSQNSL